MRKEFIELMYWVQSIESLIDENIQKDYYIYETHQMDPPTELVSGYNSITEGLTLLRRGIDELYK